MLRQNYVVCALLAGSMTVGAGVVSAQTYPNKPIRMSTVAAGSSADTLGRLVGQGLTDSMGQPVIVENRPAIPAIEAGAKAPPDGYTLLLIGSTTWILPLLQSNVSWDPVRDFAPLLLATESPLILVVHPSLPVKSVKELIALAKARPAALNYGASTVGSASHLAAELFKYMAGINIVGVHYKSNEPATIALGSGEVQMTFVSVSTGSAYIKSGKIHALGVSSMTPSALAPGMPTLNASGVPGYSASSVNVFFVPAKTPPTIITRLNQEIVRILNRPEIKEKLLADSQEASPSTPEELSARIKSEMSSMAKVIKAAGIKGE